MNYGGKQPIKSCCHKHKTHSCFLDKNKIIIIRIENKKKTFLLGSQDKLLDLLRICGKVFRDDKIYKYNIIVNPNIKKLTKQNQTRSVFSNRYIH